MCFTSLNNSLILSFCTPQASSKVMSKKQIYWKECSIHLDEAPKEQQH